jgi:hypothetical protein
MASTNHHQQMCTALHRLHNFCCKTSALSPISTPAHPPQPPPCRFIVENYNLRYLLNEVPEKDRLHPVALPAFPSTAPTGHVRRQVRGLSSVSSKETCPVCGMLLPIRAARGVDLPVRMTQHAVPPCSH